MDMDKNFFEEMELPIPDSKQSDKGPEKEPDAMCQDTVEADENVEPIVNAEEDDDTTPVKDENEDLSQENEAFISEANGESNSEILDSLGKLSEDISSVSSQVKELKNSMSAISGYGTAVETLKRSLNIYQHNEEKMYKELDEYRKNQYFNYIKPYLCFLIELLLDMLNSKKQYMEDKDDVIAEGGEDIFNDIIKLHDDYIQMIKGQLQIQGVEILSYECGDSFISTEQMITKTVLTDNKELEAHIAYVDSDCYKFEDKVLKKAKVHVYKKKPTVQ